MSASAKLRDKGKDKAEINTVAIDRLDMLNVGDLVLYVGGNGKQYGRVFCVISPGVKSVGAVCYDQTKRGTGVVIVDAKSWQLITSGESGNDYPEAVKRLLFSQGRRDKAKKILAGIVDKYKDAKSARQAFIEKLMKEADALQVSQHWQGLLPENFKLKEPKN